MSFFDLAQLKPAYTVDGMRLAIEEQRRTNPVVHNAMTAAEHKGVSGEDTYVILAYALIERNNKLEEALLNQINSQPGTKFMKF